MGGGRESRQASPGLGGSVCTHACLGSPEVVCARGPLAGQGGEAGEKAGPRDGRPCSSFVAGLPSAA